LRETRTRVESVAQRRTRPGWPQQLWPAPVSKGDVERSFKMEMKSLSKLSHQIGEAWKLTQITGVILRNYLRICMPDQRSKDFFTDLYISNNLERRFSNRIPRVEFAPLLESIEECRIHTYVRFESHYDAAFSYKTEYKVSPFELSVLCSLVKYLNPKNIFEIGTFRGWTVANMALNASPECKISTLDLSLFESESSEIEKIFIEHQIQRLYGDSRNFDFGMLRGRVDLVFIDACHSKESVVSDTESAFKMLSSTGTIVWHDYNPKHPGVVDCLHEYAAEFPIYHIRGSNLALYSRNPKFKNPARATPGGQGNL